MFQFPHLSLLYRYWAWQMILTGSIWQIWLENSDYYALVEALKLRLLRELHTQWSVSFIKIKLEND